MASIRNRTTIALTAVGLAAASATGGALVAGGGPASAAAGSAKSHKQQHTRPMRQLNRDIRAALKEARGGKHERLSPETVRTVAAKVVKADLANGTVKQQAVDRRAARLRALAEAFGG